MHISSLFFLAGWGAFCPLRQCPVYAIPSVRVCISAGAWTYIYPVNVQDPIRKHSGYGQLWP